MVNLFDAQDILTKVKAASFLNKWFACDDFIES